MKQTGTNLGDRFCGTSKRIVADFPMPTPSQDSSSRSPNVTRRAANLDPERYAQLKAELKAPYRGLRQFIYIGFAASGFIGAVIFLAQLLAGCQVDAALPNLALQVGVVALMIWLFRLEQRAGRKQ